MMIDTRNILSSVKKMKMTLLMKMSAAGDQISKLVINFPQNPQIVQIKFLYSPCSK